jgi:dihydropteroate synthase
MRYHEAARFLQDLRRFRSKPGTRSTAELLSHLDDPHCGPSYVQVAGSNGKGSTARMVESICREADLDVGLYTSPHLNDFRERITVNGRQIPETHVAEFVGTVREYLIERAAGDEPATFFETMTALALWHFGREGVDIAVLEVGIGGRLDATSVVEPDASCVTSVSLEHTELLGESVSEIARDKASVTPENRPLVTAADGAALEAIQAVTDDVVTVGDADADVVTTYHGRTNDIEADISIHGPDWSVQTCVPTVGDVQARNAGVASVLAIQVADVGEDAIAKGLRSAHWPGRVETVERNPRVILDGAHNPAACRALSRATEEFDFEECHIVFGAMHEKDHMEMAAALPESASAFTCRADTDRGADPEVLSRVLQRAGHDARVCPSVDAAIEEAQAGAEANDLVLVCGSLAVVAEARTRWTRVLRTPRIQSQEAADHLLARAHVADADIQHTHDGLVHKTVHTQMRPRRAQTLATEFRELGGTAALSALTDLDEDAVGIVLSGSISHFEELVGTARGRDAEMSRLARQVYDRVLEDTRTPTDGDSVPWSDGTAVMGILNVTPDSFHDGGEYDTVAAAVERAERMVAEGADIIDVGGESTRPGADPVPVDEEIERVAPVIEAIADSDVAVSVDTRKAAVAEAALNAGADILNDVSGLDDPEMRFVAAEHDVPIAIMHSINTPVDPDATPTYDDPVTSVIEELVEPVHRALQAGLDPSQIIVDPGLGFGKDAATSMACLERADEFTALGCPVMVGHSHKSMFELPGFGDDDRMIPTVTGTAIAADRGVDIVRVHDVAENVAAVRTIETALGASARGRN